MRDVMPSHSTLDFTRVANSLFNVAKHFINNPLSLFMYVLYLQTLQAVAFNKKTLLNVQNYLVENRLDINWEINESGFVRIQLPIALLDLNQTIFHQENTNLFRLRCNFWYSGELNGVTNERLIDAASHDHPSRFMSYIVNAGYAHEVFKVVSLNTSAIECPSNSSKGCTVVNTYHKREKKLEISGVAELTKVEDSSVEPGNIVIIDDATIHRIKGYQANTLTLNTVHLDSKFKTNIYISPFSSSVVKTERVVLRNDDAHIITDKAIELYKLAIKNLDQISPRVSHPLNDSTSPLNMGLFSQYQERSADEPEGKTMVMG
jgi:hypothetical protein